MLTNENYFSAEMEKKHMNNSQVKNFMQCESMALAKINGEFAEDPSPDMLVGSYVDAHFEKSLDLFKAKTPQIFTKGGDLLAKFKQAETVIERIERDEFFMQYMNGQKQTIKTGEIAGVLFKTKIDSYLVPKNIGDLHAIVDLKVLKDMKKVWQDGAFENFIVASKYDMQGAIYQAVEGNQLPFFLAVATKEKEPDLAVIEIPQERLDYCLSVAKEVIPRYQKIKLGEIEPTRCESCNYCRKTKVLKEVVSMDQLGA